MSTPEAIDRADPLAACFAEPDPPYPRDEAVATILDANIFGDSRDRACPSEMLCEGTCTNT